MTRTRVHESAYAKINLFLEVHARRADGFHELDTIMHEIDLTDDVVVTKAEVGCRLVLDDPSIDAGENNLAVKAVRAVEDEIGRELPCHIALTKNIPAGGGLGGGSSDAAAVVRALNQLYDLRLSVGDMETIVGRFGSDTSFFVRGGTSRCRGRGELVEPLLDVPDLDVVLVFPGLFTPTGPIFKALQVPRSPRSGREIIDALVASRPLSEVRAALFNRLEGPARSAFPDLARLLDEQAESGLRLSGSGSTLFALAADAADAAALAGSIRRATGLTCLAVRSARRRR